MNDDNLTLGKSNIAQDPFSPAPVESDVVFLLTPALQNHTNTLLNIAKSGTSIGLVKGDPGSGKTSLANYLARRLQQEPNIKLWKMQAQPDTELIPALAKEAGMTDEALGNEPRKRLIEYLTQLRSSGIIVVLIIDDAHLLTPQALHLVIRLGLSPAVGQNGLMHTLLFAESDIEGRLWLSAITDPLPLDRLYTLVLPALNAEQTYAYIKHRLKVADYPDNAAFSQADANSIHRKAAGVPGAINELAGRRLSRRSGERMVTVRMLPAMTLPQWSRGIAVTGLALVVAGVVSLWWYMNPNPEAAFVRSDQVIVSNPSSITQESASLFAAATQKESVLTLPRQDSTPAISDQKASITSPDQAPKQFSQPATTAPDSKLLQTNQMSVDTGKYSIQKTADVLITPSTPENPPAPKEILPGPQASPQAQATPEAVASSLSQRDGSEDKHDAGKQTSLSTDVVEAPRTPVDKASPEKIEGHSLLPTTEMVNVSDSALADSPDTRYSFKIPQDTLVDQTLRVNAAEHTPEPPALTKSETEPVIVATNLPPRQPVALAKPFADNGKTPPKASDKVQQIDGRFDQVEKTPAPSIDQTDAAPSGQRIALNSVRREKWLKQRQPHEYTVQIMSGPNETGLRQFIERNRFPTTPSYYRARNGQYKLVLPYPDESQARQALKNLPETLRRYGRPWVRSMADVQKDML